MNRHDEDIRAARCRRESLAKARCAWAAVMAILLVGMIYFCSGAAKSLAWCLDGDKEAGWSAVMWATPFLLCAVLAFLSALEWPYADDPEK